MYAPVFLDLLSARELGVGGRLDLFHVLIILDVDLLRGLILDDGHECTHFATMSEATDAVGCVVSLGTYRSCARSRRLVVYGF